MNERNEWDQIADTVEGPIERAMIEEIVEVFKYLKIGKVPEPIEAYTEMILASGEVGIKVLMKLCHRILDGRRNARRLGYQCSGISYFLRKRRYHDLWHV